MPVARASSDGSRRLGIEGRRTERFLAPASTADEPAFGTDDRPKRDGSHRQQAARAVHHLPVTATANWLRLLG